MHLFERLSTDWEEEIFHPLGLGSRLKPRAWSSIQVYHVGAGAQALVCCFPGSISKVLDQKWSRQRGNWCSEGMLEHAGDSLTHCAATLAQDGPLQGSE